MRNIIAWAAALTFACTVMYTAPGQASEADVCVMESTEPLTVPDWTGDEYDDPFDLLAEILHIMVTEGFPRGDR